MHDLPLSRAQIFPPLGVVPIYRRLAETCRVTYYPIYSTVPSKATIDRMKDEIEGEPCFLLLMCRYE